MNQNLNRMKNLFSLLIVIALLASCSKDDPDNATLKISASIESSAGAAKTMNAASKSMADNMVFTSGYVWLREVVFDGDFASGNSVSRTVERFSQIDFATGIATPSLDDIVIPPGEYTGVNLGLELRDEDAQPSIIMEGTYTRTDTSVVPIRFEFNSGEVFEAETDQQVNVVRGQIVTARIIFDPNVWFSIISNEMLDNANVNMEGTVVISENSNANIFDLVADRLDVSTQSEFQ